MDIESIRKRLLGVAHIQTERDRECSFLLSEVDRLSAELRARDTTDAKAAAIATGVVQHAMRERDAARIEVEQEKARSLKMFQRSINTENALWGLWTEPDMEAAPVILRLRARVEMYGNMASFSDRELFETAAKGREEAQAEVRRLGAEIEKLRASFWSLAHGEKTVACLKEGGADCKCMACYGNANLKAWVEQNEKLRADVQSLREPLKDEELRKIESKYEDDRALYDEFGVVPTKQHAERGMLLRALKAELAKVRNLEQLSDEATEYALSVFAAVKGWARETDSSVVRQIQNMRRRMYAAEDGLVEALAALWGMYCAAGNAQDQGNEAWAAKNRAIEKLRAKLAECRPVVDLVKLWQDDGAGSASPYVRDLARTKLHDLDVGE